MRTFKMITVTFIGLLFALFLVVADDRGIVVDDIVTETGTPAWEYAFLTYVLFLTMGVIIESVGPSPDANHVILSAVGVGASMLILNAVVNSTTGDIATAFTSIKDEFLEWFMYVGVLVGFYLINLFRK